MRTELALIYEEIRNVSFNLEKNKELIKGIPDKNATNVRVKEVLKRYSNTCIADLLIFNDLLYQLIECENDENINEVLEQFEELEDE